MIATSGPPSSWVRMNPSLGEWSRHGSKSTTRLVQPFANRSSCARSGHAELFHEVGPSKTIRSSTTLSPTKRRQPDTVQDTLRPVGAIPMRSPWWVPVGVPRHHRTSSGAPLRRGFAGSRGRYRSATTTKPQRLVLRADQTPSNEALGSPTSTGRWGYPHTCEGRRAGHPIGDGG